QNHRNASRLLADALVGQAKHGEAAETIVKWARSSPVDRWQNRHVAVGYLNRYALQLAQDAKLSDAERKARAKTLQDGVRAWLKEAIQHGAKVIPGTLEAELLPVLETKNCLAVPQAMTPWGAEKWSDGHQLFCRSQLGGYVVLEVSVPADGDYRLD